MGGKGRGWLGTIVCTSFELRDDANTGPAGYVCLKSVMEGELLGVDCCVGWETDLLATPFVLVPAFFAACVGWSSFLAVDSPVAAALLAATIVYAALSGVLRGLSALPTYAALSGRHATLAAMLFWAALSDGYGGDACCDGYSLEFLNWDGCRNLLCRFDVLLRLKQALPLLYERFGPAAAKPVGRGENIRLLVLFELVQCVLCAENWVPASSSQDNDSLNEEVEIESVYEPEPPCTMVEVQGTDVFDIPMEARRRGLDEHELTHFVFEHGVSEGVRLAESQRGRARPVARFDESVFDIPAIARRMGWDEHELMYNVFELGEEEGMWRMTEITEDDASSVVFQGGVVQEPRVCLALDELISITEVRQACEAPEPAKSVLFLFRGEHGLGV